MKEQWYGMRSLRRSGADRRTELFAFVCIKTSRDCVARGLFGSAVDDILGTA